MLTSPHSTWVCETDIRKSTSYKCVDSKRSPGKHSKSCYFQMLMPQLGVKQNKPFGKHIKCVQSKKSPGKHS